MKPKTASHVKAKVRDSKRLEALLAIGKLIAPKAKSLAAQVTQAFDEPAAYIAVVDRVDPRGIGEDRG
jgi:hypothetical protein